MADPQAARWQSAPVVESNGGGRWASAPLVEAPQVGDAEGLLRSASQGISMGWADEVQAGRDAAIARGYEGQGKLGAVAAGLERANPIGMLVGLAKDMVLRDPEYLKRLSRERGRTSAYAEENPVKAGAAEFAGGVASAFVPGGAAVRTGQTLGQLARAGMRQGSIYGLLSGAGGGGTGEGGTLADDVANRGVSGVVGGVVGGVLGGIGGYVGGRIGQRVGQVRAAQAETATPATAADNVLTRTLERDRIDPQGMIAQIREGLPRGAEQDARRSLTTADVETFMRMRRDGASTREIASSLGISDATVRRYGQELETRSITPLSLVDHALLGGAGRGQNVLWKMKGAASTPGEARATAHETFIERQMGAGERVAQAIRTHVASGDIEGQVATRIAAMRAAERDAYRVAETAERPYDIGPALDRTVARFQDRKGEVTDGVMRAVGLFERPVEVMTQDGAKVAAKELRRVNGLRGFVDAKQELDQMIERSFVDRRPTQLTRELVRLKTELMDEVSRTNPVWRAANDFFADGRAAERMLDMGQQSALRLNGGMREVLGEWKKLADTSSIRRSKLLSDKQAEGVIELRKELFREGLSRALQDRILNRQPGHDIAAELRTPAARQILTTVLGRDRAEAILRVVEHEHAALRTQRSLFGSQTGGLLGEQTDLAWAPRISSVWDLAKNPTKAFDLVAERVAAGATERQNSDLMRMLSTMDPIQQLDILRRLQAMTAARAQGRGDFGPWGSAASASVVNPLTRQDEPRNPQAGR